MRRKNSLFHNISSMYGFFFNIQIKHFTTIFENLKNELDLSDYKNIIDIGCGTGLITDIAEWLEGGDYFNFIKTIKHELNDKFDDVKIINANVRSALYVAKS